MGIIPHHPGCAQLRGGQAGLKARVTGGAGIPQQAVMVQYHGGGGADGRAPTAQGRLFSQQVDGEGGVADSFAAGHAARHDHGIEVAAGQLIEMAVGDDLHPAGGADLARSRGAAGGQHHLYAAAHQGVDDGDSLYLFRPRGYQYQYCHPALLRRRQCRSAQRFSLTA
ncbi:hypothetical protein D3C86_1631690 [compost metagenome]